MLNPAEPLPPTRSYGTQQKNNSHAPKAMEKLFQGRNDNSGPSYHAWNVSESTAGWQSPRVCSHSSLSSLNACSGRSSASTKASGGTTTPEMSFSSWPSRRASGASSISSSSFLEKIPSSTSFVGTRRASTILEHAVLDYRSWEPFSKPSHDHKNGNQKLSAVSFPTSGFTAYRFGRPGQILDNSTSISNTGITPSVPLLLPSVSESCKSLTIPLPRTLTDGL
jgi:hypothetical protein